MIDINEDIYKLEPSEELKQKSIERNTYHINLVNKYGSKIGKEYPNHDASKLGDLLDAYCYYMKPEEKRTKAENDALDLATFIHITNSPHHPEYWTDTDLSGFTRKNFTPHGIIDATDMPLEFIEEMCADWCSCSYEFKNTPIDWFNKVNGKRWLFDVQQQNHIRNTINIMWGGFDEWE